MLNATQTHPCGHVGTRDCDFLHNRVQIIFCLTRYSVAKYFSSVQMLILCSQANCVTLGTALDEPRRLERRWTNRDKLVRNSKSQLSGTTGVAVTLNPNLPTEVFKP